MGADDQAHRWRTTQTLHVEQIEFLLTSRGRLQSTKRCLTEEKNESWDIFSDFHYTAKKNKASCNSALSNGKKSAITNVCVYEWLLHD